MLQVDRTPALGCDKDVCPRPRSFPPRAGFAPRLWLLCQHRDTGGPPSLLPPSPNWAHRLGHNAVPSPSLPRAALQGHPAGGVPKHPTPPVTCTAARESLRSSSQPSQPPVQSPDKPPCHVPRAHQCVPRTVPSGCQSPSTHARGHAGLTPGGGLLSPHATPTSCDLRSPRHPPWVTLHTGGDAACPCPPTTSKARQRGRPAAAQHQLPRPGRGYHTQTDSALPAPKEPRLQPRRTPGQAGSGHLRRSQGTSCQDRRLVLEPPKPRYTLITLEVTGLRGGLKRNRLLFTDTIWTQAISFPLPGAEPGERQPEGQGPV